jgi:hypothetical protein
MSLVTTKKGQLIIKGDPRLIYNMKANTIALQVSMTSKKNRKNRSILGTLSNLKDALK